MAQEPRILIIGAGIAGLSLAQGLKQASIPFHIFERDTSSSFRAQGYRIRIGREGAAALKRLLPGSLWDAFEATCAEMVHGGRQMDAKTGETAEWGGRGPPGRMMPDGKSYNVDRAVLRDLLLCGLEDSISFGKRLERYDESDGAGIHAHFTDGTADQGTFLVGADGIRSIVRKQLLPNMTVLDTEGRAVFGKTNITDEAMEEVPYAIGNGITLIGAARESHMKLFTDGMRFSRDQSSGPEMQLGLNTPADYIYWVLVFRKDLVSADEEDSLPCLSNEQSAQKALDLTSDWSEKIRAVLKHQTREAASTLAFLNAGPNFVSEFKLKPSDSKGRVTLLGDSAHPMPPVGGVGANSGLQDSADLCDALIGYFNTASQEERGDLINAFEDKMLQRAEAAVERSSGGGGHFFGMRPVSELKPATLWH